jgi:flagellar protein FliS
LLQGFDSPACRDARGAGRSNPQRGSDESDPYFSVGRKLIRRFLMQNYGQHQYGRINVGTADRGRLVVLLYEGAINFLKKAKNDVQEGNIDAKCNNINRAQDIIQELNNSLKMDEGGEIAGNLRSLYFFMERHLVMAKIERDGDKNVDEVISMLSSLCEAWVEISTKPEVKNIIPADTSTYTGLSSGINAGIHA